MTLAAIVAAGVVAAAVVLVRDGSSSDVAGTAVEATPTLVPPPTGPDGEPLPPPRPLGTEEPLRLYIAGDSLAGSLAYELAPLVAGTGVVAPTYDSHAGSGLASDDMVDWEDRATTEPERIGAEAVVYVMGTNDFWVVTEPTDPAASWRSEYAAEVASVVERLSGEGRRPVIWVGAPVTADAEMSDQLAALNAVAAEELARHADVVFVDAFALFSGPDGGYAAELTDDTGAVVAVRQDDGVHFTSAGAALLAREVFAHLDARWRISAQADPGVVQPVDVSPGGEGGAPG